MMLIYIHPNSLPNHYFLKVCQLCYLYSTNSKNQYWQAFEVEKRLGNWRPFFGLYTTFLLTYVNFIICCV